MSSETGKINISWQKAGAIMIAVAVIYFVVARLSLLLAAGHTNASPVWPPSGIALAVILLWGYRMGLAVLAGAFFANMLVLKGFGLEPAYFVAASLSTAIGNMLGGLAGAYFIRRFAGTDTPFNTLKDLFVFIIFGSLVSTLISASIGAASFCQATGQWQSIAPLWLTWWLGDAAGVLIVTPLIVMLKKKMLQSLTRSQCMEAIVVLLVLTVSSGVIFFYNYQAEYVLIPPLLWIALRFGRVFSAGAVFLVSGIAILCAVSGAGLLPGQAAHHSLLYLQTYISVIAIITLCLSVLTHERRETDRSLLTAQKQLYDIIEFLPDATFAIDKNGQVIAWNRAMEMLSGISKKDMVGKADYEYAIPFFGERRPILIDMVMKKTDPTQLENYKFIEQRENTLIAERYNTQFNRFFSSAASALIDRNGNVSGAIASIRDITVRKVAERDLQHYKEHLEDIVKERSAELVDANEKLIEQIEKQARAEVALSASERKYRDLVEGANSIIMRWKPDGSITFFNTYAQKFFGFAESEVIGKNILRTIVPILDSSGRDLSTLIEDIVRNPEAHAFNENENIRKNGDKVWIAWTNRPIFDEAGALAEISVSRQ